METRKPDEPRRGEGGAAADDDELGFRDVDEEAEHDEAGGQGRGGRLEDEPDER